MKMNFNIGFVLVFVNILFIVICECDVKLLKFEDVKECQIQLDLINSDLGLFMKFKTSSGKLYPSLIAPSTSDLGNFDYCLSTKEAYKQSEIEGKYCQITAKVSKDIVDEVVTRDFDEWPDNTVMSQMQVYSDNRRKMCGYNPGPRLNETIKDLRVYMKSTMGVCIPKVCSFDQTTEFIRRITNINNLKTKRIEDIDIEVDFCRLNDDKEMETVDYYAVIFITILLSCITMSTTYEVYHLKYYHNEENSPKPNQVYISFSLYSNTCHLLKTSSSPTAVECVDGIRVLSMGWIVLYHTYIYNFGYRIEGKKSYMEYLIYLTGTNAVDTFLLLSGTFVVYSTIGKYNTNSFISNLPMFYLNRILRLYPVLCTIILLQGSLFNHLGDGPQWYLMTEMVEGCKTKWWQMMLFIGNLMSICDFEDMSRCLYHGWYLELDMQCYIISPVVLFWLFGDKKVAAAALIAAVLFFITTSNIFSFLLNYEFTGTHIIPFVPLAEYLHISYGNPLVRAAPFFIGMTLGYILHLQKQQKVLTIPRRFLWLLWPSSLIIIFCSVYDAVPLHRQQVASNLLWGFMRSFWSVSVSWIIFACHRGYGGPLNWFLSLKFWKLPAKVSYSLYLVHIPLIFAFSASRHTVVLYSLGYMIYCYIAVMSISFIAACVLTLAVDTPINNLLNLILRPRTSKRTDDNI